MFGNEPSALLIKMMMILMMITMMIPCVSGVYKKPDLIKVGGSDGWRSGFDFFAWAREHEFYVGDSLYFGYNRTLFTVLVVNETDFKTCRTDDPIQNITGGAGEDFFNLTSAQTYYFISGGGYCNKGVRVAIEVIEWYGYHSPPRPAIDGRRIYYYPLSSPSHRHRRWPPPSPSRRHRRPPPSPSRRHRRPPPSPSRRHRKPISTMNIVLGGIILGCIVGSITVGILGFYFLGGGV